VFFVGLIVAFHPSYISLWCCLFFVVGLGGCAGGCSRFAVLVFDVH